MLYAIQLCIFKTEEKLDKILRNTYGIYTISYFCYKPTMFIEIGLSPLFLSLSLTWFFSTSCRNVCFIVQLSIFQFIVVPIVSFLKLFSCLRFFCKVIDQLKFDDHIVAVRFYEFHPESFSA